MKSKLTDGSFMKFFLALVMGFWFVNANAESSLENFIKDHHVQLAYVQVARSAVLTPQTGQDKQMFTLTLNFVHPYVYYFSDRPHRLTGMIDIKKFLGYWQDNSKNSFKNDLPNASLVALETGHALKEKDLVFELSNPVYDETTQTLSYTAKALNPLPSPKYFSLTGFHFNEVSLFIDGHGSFCMTC